MEFANFVNPHVFETLSEPRLLRLATARLSCLVTARYVHAAAAPSSYGAVVFAFSNLVDSCLAHDLAAWF